MIDVAGSRRAAFEVLQDVVKVEPKRASYYAYTPDKDDPSTWKLPIHDGAHASAAAAALSSGGFRGQKAQIPSSALAGVKAKVRAAWHRFYPDKDIEDMPESIRKYGEPGIYTESYIDPMLGSTFAEITDAMGKQLDMESKVRRACVGFDTAKSLVERSHRKQSGDTLDVDGLLRELAAYLKAL